MANLLHWGTHLRSWSSLGTDHSGRVSVEETRTYEGWLLVRRCSFRTASTGCSHWIILALECQCRSWDSSIGFTADFARANLGWSQTILRQLWHLCVETLGLTRTLHHRTACFLGVELTKILLIFFKKSVLISSHHWTFLWNSRSVFEGWKWCLTCRHI